MDGDVPNWSEEICMIKIDQHTLQWTCVIIDLNGKEIVEKFYEKKLKKTEIKKNLEQKKKLGGNAINYMSNESFMIIHLIVRLIKNKQLNKKSYFSEIYPQSKSKMEVELYFV